MKQPTTQGEEDKLFKVNMKEELLALFNEYMADCEKWPVYTGFTKPVKFNNDGTCIVEEIVTNGIEPTFPGFIAWLRTKV